MKKPTKILLVLREYKYTLGQKLKEVPGKLLDRIIIANSEEDTKLSRFNLDNKREM